MPTIIGPIRTSRLLLRPFTLGDVDDVWAMRSREDVVRFLYGGPMTREQAAELVQRKAKPPRLEQDDDAMSLAVVVPDAPGRWTGLIGDISLTLRSVEHRQGEIGFVFHPDHQGRGYATEAATAVLGFAFDRLGLHRVFARADALNVASARLMRRLGMRQEAHFRENEMFKGAWGDEVVFAILAREWRERAGREA